MLKVIKCSNCTYVIFLPVEIDQALQAKTVSMVKSLLVNKREKRMFGTMLLCVLVQSGLTFHLVS